MSTDNTVHKFVDDAAVIAFVSAHSDQLDLSVPPVVEEIGDGNINFVYRVRDHRGKSLIVKQALPYIRIIGEGWPLSLDRIRIEADVLRSEACWAPHQVPELLYFSPADAAILMQDIGDHQNLRHALIERRELPGLGLQIGDFLAATLFHTSDLFLNSTAKKEQLASFINPDLCGISEEVYFIDPFCDHERNSVNPLLLQEAKQIWADDALRAEVAELKYGFMNRTEALIHGDLHTGSIFVRDGSIKVIDPEFAFCGPVGFDLGTVLANFLLNFSAQLGLPSEMEEKNRYQHYLLQQLRELWNSFSQSFLELAEQKSADAGLASVQWRARKMADFFADMLGYAGVEMMRRTLGIAHVADLEQITDESVRVVSERLSIRLACLLITRRGELSGIEELLKEIQALQQSL
ncbi:S-methyl-5-thioribose kinase [Nitrincola sp. MINF-07-Sa-05]|uniref:S-methyl-5-thioribose kinase n=1 Tax=Nitrincola salilacus TaxID=3400273 RepID=UPI0039183486